MWTIILWLIVVHWNFYKLPLIAWNEILQKPYRIFPWMLHGQKSSSNPYWMFFHICDAIVHLALSLLLFSYKDLKRVHDRSHRVFTLTVLMNVQHFGEADFTKALIGNGLPLLGMQLFKDNFRLARSWIEIPRKWWWLSHYMYTFCLLSAPLFEIALWFMS